MTIKHIPKDFKFSWNISHAEVQESSLNLFKKENLRMVTCQKIIEKRTLG